MSFSKCIIIPAFEMSPTTTTIVLKKARHKKEEKHGKYDEGNNIGLKTQKILFNPLFGNEVVIN